jgi:hypothetical protein
MLILFLLIYSIYPLYNINFCVHWIILTFLSWISLYLCYCEICLVNWVILPWCMSVTEVLINVFKYISCFISIFHAFDWSFLRLISHFICVMSISVHVRYVVIFLFWTWRQPYIDSITCTWFFLFYTASMCMCFWCVLYSTGVFSFMDAWNAWGINT